MRVRRQCLLAALAAVQAEQVERLTRCGSPQAVFSMALLSQFCRYAWGTFCRRAALFSCARTALVFFVAVQARDAGYVRGIPRHGTCGRFHCYSMSAILDP